MRPLVAGFGIYDPKTLPNLPRNERIHLNKIWNHVLLRSTQRIWNLRPAYHGCTIAKPFHRFSTFATWALDQPGWDKPKFQIDKDIIIKGNKCYSPDAYIFVPAEINVMFLCNKGRRGQLPIGVMFDNRGNKYVAHCSVGGNLVNISRHATPQEAFVAYKAFKEQHIRNIAEKYRHEISQRAYLAMLAYQVEITD